MKNLNASGSISYFVERVVDKENAILSIPKDTDENVIEIELNISGWTYFKQGNTYGPPEKCFPDESESEITNVEILNSEYKQFQFELTPSEKENIMNELITNIIDEKEAAKEVYINSYKEFDNCDDNFLD